MHAGLVFQRLVRTNKVQQVCSTVHAKLGILQLVRHVGQLSSISIGKIWRLGYLASLLA